MGKIIYGNYIIEKYKEGYRVFLISIDKFVYCDSYREAVNEIHNAFLNDIVPQQRGRRKSSLTSISNKKWSQNHFKKECDVQTSNKK